MKVYKVGQEKFDIILNKSNKIYKKFFFFSN